MNDKEEAIAKYSRLMNGGIPAAIFQGLDIYRRTDLGSQSYYLNALNKTLPYNDLNVTIQCRDSTDRFVIKTDNEQTIEWKLEDGTVTRIDKNGTTKFEEEKTKSEFLNELILHFFKDSSPLDSLTFEGISRSITLPENFKTRQLVFDFSGSIDEIALEYIMKQLGSKDIFVNIRGLTWRTLLPVQNCKKFVDQTVMVTMEFDVHFISEFDCKFLFMVMPTDAESIDASDVQELCELAAQHKKVGFAIDISIEQFCLYKDLVQKVGKSKGWEMKFHEKDHCASFPFGDKEANLFYHSKRCWHSLMLKIEKRGTANFHNHRESMAFSLPQKMMISKYFSLKKRTELSRRRWLRDAAYYLNKIVVNCAQKTFVIDGVMEDFNDLRYTLDDIFKNMESKVNIIQIDGHLDQHLLNEFNLHLFNANKLILNYRRAHTHEGFRKFYGIEKVVATSKKTISRQLAVLEKSTVEILEEDGSDSESEENEDIEYEEENGEEMQNVELDEEEDQENEGFDL